MQPSDERPRGAETRYLLSSHFTLVLVACLLVAALGGYVAYQEHTAPDTTTESRTVGTWESSGDFRHGAVVQRDARAFDEGQVLQNRSLYFSSVAPVLNGSYVYRHAGEAEPATVETELQLVVRSVRRTGGETQVYWRVSEPIDERTATVAPGEPARTDFAVNVTAQSALAEAVAEDLGASPGRTEAVIVAETTAETSLAGEELADERTDALRIAPTTNAYTVEADLGEPFSDSVTETVEVPVESDPVRLYGSILASLLGLGGAAALVGLERTGRLTVSPAARTAIERRRERDSFAEWISRGRVPPPADGERVIAVDSLEDLVDVAIDCDRRVLEDGRDGSFAVLDGETRYVYAPDSDRPSTPGSHAGADPLDAEPEGSGGGRPDTSADGSGGS